MLSAFVSVRLSDTISSNHRNIGVGGGAGLSEPIGVYRN